MTAKFANFGQQRKLERQHGESFPSGGVTIKTPTEGCLNLGNGYFRHNREQRNVDLCQQHSTSRSSRSRLTGCDLR